MPSLLTWYHTVRYLKPRQIWYLIWRPLAIACSRKRRASPKDIAAALRRGSLLLSELEVNPSFNPRQRSFLFLNIEQVFKEGIEWDFRKHGLHWAYHLNYFEWLYDDSLTLAERLKTMQAFTTAPSRKVGSDAYPASLRAMSWIRFMLRYGIVDEGLLQQLFSDADWLCRFPEYQLDGNHLFENALAIVACGTFFQNEQFFRKGAVLLEECLCTQILADGAHVEGSIMYHSLLLWHCLQCLELLRHLPFGQSTIEHQLATKIERMLGWLEAMSFSDGTWPMFHDATEGVAPSLSHIKSYASKLGLKALQLRPKESGYRMLRVGDWELAINTAIIQPAYQPGHAHADIASFCLHYQGRPVLVDTGVTVYEPGSRRREERETAAHNTVTIGGQDSSEMWRSFRVGRRAKLLTQREAGAMLELCYTPAILKNCQHKRRFLLSEDGLRIEDELSGKIPAESCARLHFHPRLKLQKISADKLLTDGMQIHGSGQFEMTQFRVSKGFNLVETAPCAAILFTNSLFIEIKITRC